MSFLWIRIRKGQLRGRTLLAKDIKYKPNLEQLLKLDIGYIDFKNICISLNYLQQIKNNIFVMIRQVGPPTFFFTFTSAEHEWMPLVNSLSELQRKGRKRKHIETIEDFDVDYIIRKDLVTCSRYYRNRINAIKQLTSHEKIFFGKILDYYFVTEFQNRRSEHDHALLWTENAPIYGKFATQILKKKWTIT